MHERAPQENVARPFVSEMWNMGRCFSNVRLSHYVGCLETVRRSALTENDELPRKRNPKRMKKIMNTHVEDPSFQEKEISLPKGKLK